MPSEGDSDEVPPEPAPAFYATDPQVLEEGEKAEEMSEDVKLKNQKRQRRRERRIMYAAEKAMRNKRSIPRNNRPPITTKNQLSQRRFGESKRRVIVHAVDFSQMKMAWKELVDDKSSINVFAFAYAKEQLHFIDKNTAGIDMLQQYCKEDNIVFAAFRFVMKSNGENGEKSDGRKERVQFILLPWVGSKSHSFDKARVSGMIPMFRNACSGFHICLHPASDISDVSQKEILLRLNKA
eukprot:CAMPEP_0168536002 /NCGR_PEP_ID=MMETSP0405-20121227/19199_1 /TAXON_ID=498012 /ORGANISM="Trichosphaerium sp, Strain Am-I-7 wt" /LENGTH=237 /DNA_ID=CAMNT_0008563743 /DNA_START=848 /DNA_END=1561 /DNA_ORIENTATION=+